MSSGVPMIRARPPTFEEGFVDRDSFDEGCGVFEDREHRLAGFGIRRHAWRHDNGVRAQSASGGSAHRSADPEGLRLVTGGKDHAAADDDRSAAQPWIVALLDRCVERVEIGVQDVARIGHEHMFA